MNNNDLLDDDAIILLQFSDIKDAYVRKKQIRDILDKFKSDVITWREVIDRLEDISY